MRILSSRFAWIIVVSGVLLLLGWLQRQAVAAAPTAPTATLPPGFVEEVVTSGMNVPVGFDWAADGRIFFAEKRGVVRVYQNGALLPTPFIDIQSEVNNIGDRGLLGIAVHPEFPTSPYLYLLYTYDPPEVFGNTGSAGPDGNGQRVSRLIRVTADSATGYNTAIVGSAIILLGTNSTYANIANPATYAANVPGSCGDMIPLPDCIPADERSHTIGTVMFGNDGSLFVGNGDGSSYVSADVRATRALNLDSMAGKIFRIHPLTGDAYPDNPYFDGDPTSNRSKVYNLGLRNPYRFTIHPTSGEPVIGDVGWTVWEEINSGRGANFGWPCYEGGNGTLVQTPNYSTLSQCQTFYALVNNGTIAVTPGLYAYVHVGGSSVNGGDFYTGSVYPAQYQGALFYGDYNQQWIKYLTFNPDGTVATSNNSFATAVTALVSIRRGPDTNLYYLSAVGTLYRLRYTGGSNTQPVAAADANPASGPAPLSVNFSSFGSYDPDNNPLTYEWDFGDGITSTLPHPTHTYTLVGTYAITLTVNDGTANDSDSVSVTVGNNAPVAQITSPADGSAYDVNQIINYSGTGTDLEDGALTGTSLEWELLLHHNTHIHYDFHHGTGETGNFAAADHEDDSYLELCLTVTDSGGLQDTDCINLYPNTITYTFATIPSGLTLSYSGISQTTPFTVTATVGGQRTIGAPVSQSGVYFSNWSDAGTPTHDILIQSTPITLTAEYGATPYAIVWDGGGTTNNWSDAANWSPNAVPGPLDYALFNGTSSKNATIDATYGGVVNEVIIDPGYNGTITAARTLTINGQYRQSSGTYSGSTYTFNILGAFRLQGGTFFAPSGLLRVGGGWIHTAGTFGANRGRVLLQNSTSTTLNLSGGTQFNDLILNDALAGYWPLDEGGSTTAYDFSGEGNTGTLTNMTTNAWVPGTPGTNFVNPWSLRFDGANDRINVPANAALNLNDDGVFSQAVWIYPTITDQNFHGFMGFQPAAGNTQRYPALFVYQQTRLHGGFGDGTTWHNWTTGTGVIKQNAWNHIAVTYDGTTNRVYVNGNQVYSYVFATNPIPYATQQLEIGRIGNLYFPGTIDDARIYNRVLEAAEINQLADGDELLNNAGLVGRWRLDEGTGATAADDSGNGLTGTLTGMSTGMSTAWVTGAAAIDFANRSAILFAGTNDHIAVPASTSLVLGNAFTQAAWVYPSFADNNFHGVWGYQPGGTNPQFYRYPSLYITQNSAVHAGFGDGTAFTGWTSPTGLITQNVWNHVAVSFDGTTYRLYVNGVEVHTSNALAGRTPYPSNQFYIGRVENYFPGRVDDMRLYRRVLTPTELLALANGNQPVTAPTTTSLAGALQVNGSLTLNDGVLDSAGYDITLSGDLVRSGGWLTPQTGTVTLVGSWIQTIRTDALALYNLRVNDGATVTLPATLNLLVENELDNNGALQQTRLVNGGTVPFLQVQNAAAIIRYQGVDLTSGANLGQTFVRVRVINPSGGQTCTTEAGSPAYVSRCYTITPQNNGTALVRLWALASEQNGLPTNQLTAYHFGVTGWEPLTANAGNGLGTSGYVYGEGETNSFSPFLLGGGTSPTAVTWQQVGTTPVSGWGVLMGVMGTAAATSLILIRRRI